MGIWDNLDYLCFAHTYYTVQLHSTGPSDIIYTTTKTLESHYLTLTSNQIKESVWELKPTVSVLCIWYLGLEGEEIAVRSTDSVAEAIRPFHLDHVGIALVCSALVHTVDFTANNVR